MGSAAYEERFSIPAEEQNAGRVVDYIFFRVEFHSTPGFFSDSNYLFCFCFGFFCFFLKTCISVGTRGCTPLEFLFFSFFFFLRRWKEFKKERKMANLLCQRG